MTVVLLLLVPLFVLIFLCAVVVISNAERNLALSLHLVRFLLVPRRNDAPKSISTSIGFRELKTVQRNCQLPRLTKFPKLRKFPCYSGKSTLKPIPRTESNFMRSSSLKYLRNLVMKTSRLLPKK